MKGDTSFGNGEIDWTPVPYSDSNIDGFRVEINGTEVGTAPPNASGFAVTGLTPGDTYTYGVTAFEGNLSSAAATGTGYVGDFGPGMGISYAGISPGQSFDSLSGDSTLPGTYEVTYIPDNPVETYVSPGVWYFGSAFATNSFSVNFGTTSLPIPGIPLTADYGQDPVYMNAITSQIAHVTFNDDDGAPITLSFSQTTLDPLGLGGGVFVLWLLSEDPLPVVTVSTPEATLGPSQTSASFTLTRTGDTSQSLDVPIDLAGTAVSGVNYDTSSILEYLLRPQ